MSRTWSNNSQYQHLSSELAASEDREFERRVLPLIRVIWPDAISPPAMRWLDRSGIDILVWSDTEPFPLVVQCKGFKVQEEQIGKSQIEQCRTSITAFRDSGLKAEFYLLIHNRTATNLTFKKAVEAGISELVKYEQVGRAELWDRERFLSEVYIKSLEPLQVAIEKLREIPPGINAAMEYQRHVKHMLELIFPRELRSLHLQQADFGNLECLDIIAFNKSDAGFFYSLKHDQRLKWQCCSN